MVFENLSRRDFPFVFFHHTRRDEQNPIPLERMAQFEISSKRPGQKFRCTSQD
jgi:hypothetical protein